MKRRKSTAAAIPAPLPHQKEGIDFLRSRTAAGLFDEQGLGKSKQLIEAVARDIEAQAIGGALIIAPNSLKVTWAEEIEQHSTLRYAVFGAGKKARRDAFRSLTAQFYIINYEAVAAELPALRALLKFKRMALVLDESHRIKTPAARVTRAVHSLRSLAAKRVLLSGTPVANTPADVWSQMYFLDDGASLGQTFEEFTERYGTATAGFRQLAELRTLLESAAIRRTKASSLSLPEKHITRVAVSLSGVQARMYTKLREDLALWVQTMAGETVEANAEAILARLVRLAQLASNPRLLDAGYSETPAKFQVLDQLIAKRLSSPGKLIVWSSFVNNVTELADRYARFGAAMLHGEMSQRARDGAVASFKNDPLCRVLVANPMVAREGLTLTVANVAIYVDRTFNLVDYLQSQDRIHRLSQAADCAIVLLIAQRTVDEYIDFSLEQKSRVARYAQSDQDFLAAEDAALLRPRDLRELLSVLTG